ncbi:TetR/AcrR family transcriptional regulator C-terminal domain-containing protein [Halalkalibacter sp. APA_J-10(15)]|uniref:TetR/AcrR family transcriptional regulator C-terminal domain-containing protein n=1 Tax=Halalkalibacter sp. APA_J-10(15) TaxID=2933805 RepID=UPI001FF62EB3|nr:TetR/AcrR family transcriptional regulator C-terminal domain-containing protein [Halalkalibacter sp. APA_J-10(15)]MCK0470809.1 TetR/AcrR family transcriptional regulator C-terminal domain-containing protein [Halalkalibacter sp. APA_J-10(15)]
MENDGHHKMLDKSKIVRVALEILQEEGYKSITIRKIAERLGIKSASLYWHIKNKNELLELVADEICKNIPFPNKDVDWDEQLMMIAKEWRGKLLSIRDSAIVIAETAPTTPYRRQLIDEIHGIFKKAGMGHKEAFSALWFFNTYTISFILEEYRFLEIANKDSVNPALETPSSINLTIPDMDQEFQFGMEVMITGLKGKIDL